MLKKIIAIILVAATLSSMGSVVSADTKKLHLPEPVRVSQSSPKTKGIIMPTPKQRIYKNKHSEAYLQKFKLKKRIKS